MITITAENRATKTVRQRSDLVRKLFEWGGFGAGAVLVAFGVVARFSGRATFTDSLNPGEDCRHRRYDSGLDRQGSQGGRSHERRQHADRFGRGQSD